MSRVWITADLHLGHDNAINWREGFQTPYDHHNLIYENLATAVGKGDTLYILGDACIGPHWLPKIAEINCQRKVLVVGNHDTERGVTMKDLVEVYDSVYSLMTKRHMWLSHCPIHPDEMRNRVCNIHGHTHHHHIDDERYVNVCVENTRYKPVLLNEIRGRFPAHVKRSS